MRTKSKIVVSVLSVVLCLGALVCGVWAAMTTITMPLTGSVSFDTNGIAVDINAYVEGSASSTNPYKFTHYSGAHLIDETLPDWDYGTIGFASKTEPVTFVFEVSNYATSQIRVGVEVTSESADYYAVQAPAYIAASTNGTTPTTGTATLTVNLDIGEYQTRLSATELTFTVVINEYTGDGSSQFNPIRISSEANFSFTSGLYYELASDLLLTSTTSVEVPTNVFLDGLGHQISRGSGQALFSYIGEGTTIKNLSYNVENASVYLAAFAARIGSRTSSTKSILENVSVSVSGGVSSRGSIEGAYAYAGLVAQAYNTDFIRCENNADVYVYNNFNDFYMGGIFGYTTTTCNIIKCRNNGNISTSDWNSGDLYVGGILGYSSAPQIMTGNVNNGTISTIKNFEGSNSSSQVVCAGGIVGCIGQGGSSLTYNLNNSLINVGGDSPSTTPTTTSGDHIGGIIGALQGNSSTMVSYNANLGEVTVEKGSSDGALQVGGIVGLSYGAGTRIETNYNAGNITTSQPSASSSARQSVGGIIGYVNPNNTAASSRQYVLGNYNLGALTANASSNGTLTATVAGIVGYVPTGYYCTIQANYNAGALEVVSSYSTNYPEAGIAAVSNASTITTSYISNNYYVDATTYGVYNLSNQTTSNTGCTSMTQANMQAASFADTLNTACTSAGLTGTGIFSQSSSIQNGYPYFTEIGGPEIAEPGLSIDNPIIITSGPLSFESGKFYALGNSISVSTTVDVPENVHFDGRDFTITKSSTNSIFGSIGAGSTLKDFTATHSTVCMAPDSNGYIGVLANSAIGTETSRITIEGITVNGAINTGGSTYTSAGGLVGGVYNVDFVDCTNNVNISLSSTSTADLIAGGIAGTTNDDSGDDTSTFVGCTNTGTISVSSSTSSSVDTIAGGILGHGVTSGKKTFNSCTNTGNVTVTTSTANNGGVAAGGISGRLREADITYCSNSGDIKLDTQSTNSYKPAGGIVGHFNPGGSSSSPALAQYNSNSGTVTTIYEATGNGRTIAGGIFGYTRTYLNIYTNYNVGDISVKAYGPTGSTSNAAIVGGIVGYLVGNTTNPVNVIGNYNLGNVSAGWLDQEAPMCNTYSAGIVGYSGTANRFRANYTAGTISAESQSTAVSAAITHNSLDTNVTTSYFANNYYLTGSAAMGVSSNGSSSTVGNTAMTQANMTASSFASTLNTACTSAGLTGTIFAQSSADQDGYPYFTELGPAILPAPEGSQENPYVVSTATELASAISSATADTYIEVADSVSSLTVDHIASFSGHLDGNGATITVNNSQPLFGTLTNAEVKNLTVSNSVSYNGGAYLGALALQSTNCLIDGVRIDSMTINLSIPGGEFTGYVGALIGRDTGSTIINCYTVGSVLGATFVMSSGSTNLAFSSGLIGTCSGGTQIYNCIAYVSITNNASADTNYSFAIASTSADAVVNNCVYAGTLPGVYRLFAGAPGSPRAVTNCYSLSGVTFTSASTGVTTQNQSTMQSSSFVSTLNSNAASITGVSGIRQWVYNSGSWPTPTGAVIS